MPPSPRPFARTYPDAGYRPLYVQEITQEIPVPAKNYMTAEQLEQAVAVSRERNSPTAGLAFLLGGWCGLNLREIARLTAADFDFTTGLVTIRESKNKYRTRTVPAPEFVLEAVRRHLQNQAVADVAGSLFIRENGKAADNRSLARPMEAVLSKIGLRPERVRPERERRKRERESTTAPVQVKGSTGKAIQVQTGTGEHTGPTVTAKDVRKTFINIAIAAGCERETLRRYVGHVPGDVLSAHYEAFTVDRFHREIVGKVEAFRQNAGYFADALELLP